MLKGVISKEKLVETIPYLGLDIEEEAERYVRIEYNPNRPDLSTDWGLARALNAFLEFERSWDDYKVSQSAVTLRVDASVSKIRPYIVAAVAKGVELEDESIRQIIAMQEDLHNGIGRRRRKISIGIHNFDVLRPPIEYLAEGGDFAFVPLNQDREMSVEAIVKETEVGKEYGYIISGQGAYPILRDSAGGVLSFPPIINGNLTRLSEETSNLFIDITAIDLKAAEAALSVLVTTLADAGAKVESVNVNYRGKTIVTPNLTPQEMTLNLDYANMLLGLDLTEEEAINCLRRSRIPSSSHDGKVRVWVPRYRFDILHQVDLVEEIAIGYGLNRIQPTFPEGRVSGRMGERQIIKGGIREALVGLGLVEVMTFSLVSRELLSKAGLGAHEGTLKVIDPKTMEHEIPRTSLIPSLLSVLSRNIHEEYPQRIFELSTIFINGVNGIEERSHLGVVIAHSSANFTEAKSYLSSALAQSLGLESSTLADTHPTLMEGRTARIICKGEKVGSVGEVHPRVLERFGLRTPVSAFELDLDRILSNEKSIRRI